MRTIDILKAMAIVVLTWALITAGMLVAITAFVTVIVQPGKQHRQTDVPFDLDPQGDLYPLVDFAEFASGAWKRPRATVIGTVIFVRKEADGDNHIRLEDGKGNIVVLEEIPELRMPSLPKAGDRIRAAGVSRWDDWPGHRWAELHPLTSWRIEP